ncbi:hypothetical protein [Roseivivax jejudonensis]|uniref:hypothetical protein n=1 Tax=Roseivivax jejudonensis TaxID=1529041 RepID=UPI00117B4888|nr:hypothetical protein [Roseivivax jejudonensis]
MEIIQAFSESLDPRHRAHATSWLVTKKEGLELKKIAFGMVCALLTVGTPVMSAPANVGQLSLSVETVNHGGGCRKDSPAGQCCHAGSEPYHCH